MLENIVRHMEMGKDVLAASLDGAQEIGFTILSMTFSLAAVFIPVLFMGGILGRLLHEFAVTIGAAILVSGFVSLTLTPMLCSRFLRPPDSERHGKFYAVTERFFDRMLDGYQRSLVVGDASSARDDVFFRRVAARDDLHVLRDSEGLPALGRRRPADHFHARGAGNFLRVDGRASAGGRQPHQGRSGIDSYFVSVGSGGPGGASNSGIIFCI